MIPDDLKHRLKSISIPAYLDRMGLQPVLSHPKRLKYLSPLRDEQTASFWVYLETNTYTDFGEGQKGGDIIRLVQRLHGFDFAQACKHLSNHLSDQPTASFFLISPKTSSPTNQSALILTDVHSIRSKGLWKYLHERCITPIIAEKYLVELHYRRGNKRSFALGFRNDKGGYALRNPYWKSSVGMSGITTFSVNGSTTVNLFEGFFDFLSSCCFFGLSEPRNTTIVLNSLSNLPNVLESLKSYRQANVYFDNDKAGVKAKETIKATGIHLFDGSKYYPNYNDFNSFLTQGRF